MINYKRLYEVACLVGEDQARESIRRANTIRIMRGAIWRALMQLRAGQFERARDTLEQQAKKDMSL